MLLKVILFVAAAVAAVELGLFAWVCAMAARTAKRVKADCIIVLGAKLHSDGRMSTTMRVRTEAAAEAYGSGLAKRIIACGSKLNGPESEARAMAGFLMRLGLPARDILLDENSANTYQNLENAFSIMKRENLATAAIVTSDYHLARALAMARRIGIPAVGIPAKAHMRPLPYVKARLRETVSWQVYLLINLKSRLKAMLHDMHIR